MIRACAHHEYGDNHLNTSFYDGLNDTTKSFLDSALGGQLSKIPCNKVKAKILRKLLRIIPGEEQGVRNCQEG